MDLSSVNRYFGNLELYLLDQILKKRFHPGMNILDAGSGEGRNITYFLRAGFKVYAIDKDPAAIRGLQFVAASLRPDLSREHFQVADLTHLPYPDRYFDLIICCGVLHHAENEDQFYAMFDELVRCSTAQGILFVNMSSKIGAEEQLLSQGSGRYLFPDGTLHFLLTSKLVEELKARYTLQFIEPLKTVNTGGIRCSSILVLSIPR
jgi:SAM-dependent methyltransferase